jgi:hypothetical protein
MAAAKRIQQSYGQLWQQEAEDAQVAARMAGRAAPVGSRPSTPGSTGSSALSTLGGSFSGMSLGLSMGQHEVRLVQAVCGLAQHPIMSLVSPCCWAAAARVVAECAALFWPPSCLHYC